MTEHTLDYLNEILLLERQAVERGDLQVLTSFTNQKERALIDLQKADPSAEEIQTTLDNVARSQRNLLAVIAGIKSAQDHIGNSKDRLEKISIYNRDGVIETYEDRNSDKTRRY